VRLRRLIGAGRGSAYGGPRSTGAIRGANTGFSD
jgi:hypothetical protein